MDEWMKYHQLPQPLKKQVKQAIQSQWSTTRDIDDEAILASLPWDIKSEIRRNLYLDTIRTVSFFLSLLNFLKAVTFISVIFKGKSIFPFENFRCPYLRRWMMTS